ncbi:hypothetical protein J7L48_08365 [bacterium]|nr:hypothetical protein [bacterium]
MKKLIILLWVLVFSIAFSQEITIYFTGKTFGKIEPCTCFKNPDGGIYRRVTFFNKIKNDSNKLIVDTGNIFTGGFGDEYNSVQDKVRNDLLLEVYNKIGYDCIVPGLAEMQRTKDEILKKAAAYDLTFLSSNIKSTFLPVIIKKIGNTRILIIGNSSNQYMNFKIDPSFSQNIIETKKAIANVLKKNYKHNDIVILLGSISSEEAQTISKSFPKINIFIYGKNEILLAKPFSINRHFFVQSYFESKRVGKLTLTVKKGRIVKNKMEYIRMSPSIPADPVFFEKVKNIIGKEEMRKIFHVYIFLDNTLAKEEITSVLKYLIKNKLKYAFVFNNINSDNALYFQLLNKSPELFLKGNFDPKKNNIDINSIKAENELILKNFGPFEFKKCIFSGYSFIDFNNNTLENLKKDLE